MFSVCRVSGCRGLGLVGILLLLVIVPIAWGQGSSNNPKQVTIFSSIDADKPAGAIVRIDLTLLSSLPVLTGLSLPEVVSCGPDGKLYTIEVFRGADKKRAGGRFFRLNQDGSDVTNLISVGIDDYPESFTFDGHGNLYVGTFAGNILRLDKADPANKPQLVTTVHLDYGAYFMTFLTQGPFAGDLLVVDPLNTKVIRLAAPDFTKATDFITRESAQVAPKDRFLAIALDPQGNVHVTDFDGGAVVEFGPDGAFHRSLKVPSPNQLAFDSSGKLYLTNQNFIRPDLTSGGVLVVSPDGKVTFNLRLDAARGIAVCES